MSDQVHVAIAESRDSIAAGTPPTLVYVPGKLTYVQCSCGWDTGQVIDDPYTAATAHGLRVNP